MGRWAYNKEVFKCVGGGGGGGLISGSLCYSSAGHGCNVECTPNMDSNEIV